MQGLLVAKRWITGSNMKKSIVTAFMTVILATQVVAEDGINLFKPAQVFELPDSTLLPGQIEGHSHILLHPYNETVWNDQVLKESEAERVVRAVNHVRSTLMAGVTTMRDLGSEGAGYADVGIRDAINKGIIPDPRLLVTGKAIVATGSYGPARKDSTRALKCHLALKLPMVMMNSCGSCAARLAGTSTSSRCMRTIAGARMELLQQRLPSGRRLRC